MEAVTIALMALIGLFIPSSGMYQNYLIKRHWKQLMRERRIKNAAGDTFKILSIKDEDSKGRVQILRAEVPVGLTIEHLYPVKKLIEGMYGGYVKIYKDWDDNNIVIKLVKDPNDQTARRISAWDDLMLVKKIQNRFGDTFRIRDIIEDTENGIFKTYITIPPGFTPKDLDDLKKFIEVVLQGTILKPEWMVHDREIEISLK
ncbi:MAG: hypothetical protein Q8930_15870 [Bacillota bacterium]|nr:hypothetical protein [Bacillota bacterium]